MRKFSFNNKKEGTFNIAKAISCLAIACTVSLTPAYAQQITVDGNTNTTLTINNNTTHVYTNTIKGQNAFNSFAKFNVNQGKTVNLVVPDSANNLINIVRSEKTNINGVLNAMKGNHVGGNIFLVNPYGVTVGTQGVINVGSLTVTTPTKDYVDNFFSQAGNVNDASVTSLLNGTAPINPNADITINGKINAIENVKLDAGNVTNTGDIYSGAVFEENDVTIGDVVNINTLESGAEIAVNNGEITINAVNNITNSGNIVADGGNNIDGGNVSAVAGNDIVLEPGSLISAKGKGENSSGGNVYTWGDNDSYFYKDAVLDARGGEVSGDGGFIELSAADAVNIQGGKFKAGAINGESGSILIDPTDLVIGSNAGYDCDEPADGIQSDEYRLSDGVDISFYASNSITVSDNIVISSRNLINSTTGEDVSGQNHETAVSAGDSGDITFTAPTITFGSGSKVLAFADNGFAGGDITIDASATGGSGVSLGGVLKTNGDLTIDSYGSILSNSSANYVYGKNITLTSENGTIGDVSQRLYTYLNYESDGGVFSAYADNPNGAIYIRQYPKDMPINEVIAQGDVNIYAEEDILDGNATEDANITGDNITLTSSGGSIGTTSDDLNIDSNSLLNGGLVYVNANHAGGIVNITEETGDLLINTVMSQDDVEIKADGGILSDSSANYIYGKNITLTSENSTIGDASKRLYTYLNYQSEGGVFSAYADNPNGAIYIRQYPKDMPINEVIAQGDVNIYAEEDILDGNATEDANIIGDNISLTSSGGSIGTTSDDLNIDSNSLSNGGLLYVNANHAGGTVNITEETGDLLINTVLSQDDVEIKADGGILAGTITNYVYGKNITLTSENGTIGDASKRLYTYLNYESEGGVFSAYANNPNGAIYIRQYPKDMPINEVIAQGDVNIYAQEDILDGNATEDANIIGDNISLTSRLGGIGTTSDDLNIDSNSLSNGGLLYVNANHAGGIVNITEETGDLLINTVLSQDDVEIKADGSILAGTITNYVYGKNITLTSENGTIGDASKRLYTYLNYESDGGVFSAYADNLNGAIYIRQYPKDMPINEVIAQGDVNIYAEEDILDGNASEDVNITGDNIILTSRLGGIGAAGTDNDLDIDSNTSLTATATASSTDIYINETSGDLSINSVNADTGDVYLTSAGNILDGNTGVTTAKITGDEITLTSTAGSIGGTGVDILEIDSGASGVTATASTGDIYLHEVGTTPVMVVNTISALNNIYLEASTQIDNTGGSITTSANDSTITLVTDDTLLSDTTNGSIVAAQSGTGGTVNIYNATNQAMNIGNTTDSSGSITVNEILTINADTIEFGDTTNTSSIEIYSIDGTNRNSAGTGLANITLNASGNISDIDSDDDTAKITGDNITLISTSGSIGGTGGDILEIDSYTSLTASASNGNIYLYEVGDGSTVGSDALYVNSVTAKDEIYLRSNYYINNASGTIETTADNSVIKLYSDYTNLSGGSISTGTAVNNYPGTVQFKRYSPGSMSINVTYSDNIGVITIYEYNTIHSTSANITVQDTNMFYIDNFPTTAIDLDDMPIYIFRSSDDTLDGDINVGGTGTGTYDLNQTDINLITAGDIFIGNVGRYISYGETDVINVYSADFFATGVNDSTSNVTLVASDSILDANNNDNANITARSITLESTGGSIGMINNPLDIDTNYNSSGGNLIAKATTADKGIYIKETSGDLYIRSVDLVPGVYAATSTVYLYSLTGGIKDRMNFYTDIEGGDISLYAYNGTIGTGNGTGYFDIDSSGTLYVYNEDNNVYINETIGDLYINEIYAGTADADIHSAVGSILDGNSNVTNGIEHANISAKNIILTGNIGSNVTDGDLDIDSNYNDTTDGSLTVTGTNIYIGETYSNLLVNSVNAGVGIVILNSVGSILEFNNNQAVNIEGGEITLITNNGGNVGSSTSPLDIDCSYLNLASDGNVDIRALGSNGNMNISSAYYDYVENEYLNASNGYLNIELVNNNLTIPRLVSVGDVNLTTQAGNIIIYRITSGGTVTIDSAGDISDGTPSTDYSGGATYITADTVILNAVGAIGEAGSGGDVDVQASTITCNGNGCNISENEWVNCN